MRLAEPFAVELAYHGACGLGGIVALGVLDRAKFLFADDAEGHHGAKLRERIEQELFKLPTFLDAADGFAGRVPRELASLQLAQSLDFKQVNGDVASVKGQRAVGVRHVAVVLGQVAVFHDAGLAVLQGENAHLLVRAGLVDHLGGRHAAALARKRPDECRVADAAERVVDAVEENVTHALLDKPGEGAALGKRAEATAVTVGHKCQAVVFVNDSLPVRVESADGALLEEADVFAGVSEEVVLGEEVDGRFVVERARHDAPGNCMPHLGGQILQTFRLQLEQTLVAREPDIEHALGTVEAEAGTLSASDEECGHLALAEEDFAGLFPEIVAQVVYCDLERHRLQVGGDVVFERGARLFGVKRLEFFPVLAQYVAFQGLAGIAA